MGGGVVCYSFSMTNAESTATLAQASRIQAIRRDTSNRLTLRKAGGGIIVVTEYDRESGDRHTATLYPNGQVTFA